MCSTGKVKKKIFSILGNFCEHNRIDLIVNAFIVFASENNDYELLIVGSNE